MNGKTIWIGVLLLSAFLSGEVLAEKTPKPVGEKVPKPAPPAEETAPMPVANPFISEYGVEWHPHREGTLSLSVAGPNGLSYSETFGPDTLPYFDFSDPAGSLRPDGTYHYELTENPNLDTSTYHQLQSYRESPYRGEAVEELKSVGKLPSDSLSQYGAFTFKNHQVIMGDAVNLADSNSGDSDEPSTEKDQQILDDLIVTQSICIGMDCNNGENFGFDTLRLKENNLRIKFQDTSTGSFPSTDWQLTANDSSNGGAHHFSIDNITTGRTPFRVLSGAPTNSLYVDNQGDIGLNTMNPVVELHITDGDTPTIRLEQDGSSGWTPQTWDIAGNETNFFFRDVTNGSKLFFRARPGAPENSIFIESNGNIGLGTNAPKNRLDVEGTVAIGAGYAGSFTAPTNGLIVQGNVGIGTTDHETWFSDFVAMELGANSSIAARKSNGSIQISNNAYFANPWRYKIGSTAAANYEQFAGTHLWRVAAVGAENGAITWNRAMKIDNSGQVGIGNDMPTALLQVGAGATCNGSTWIDASSRDLKKDIQGLSEDDLADLLTTLEEVDIVTFLYNQESDDTPKHVGMIAEEMPDILASKDRKGLELGRHVGFLMGVAKALRTQNQELSNDIELLRKEINDLKGAE